MIRYVRRKIMQTSHNVPIVEVDQDSKITPPFSGLAVLSGMNGSLWCKHVVGDCCHMKWWHTVWCQKLLNELSKHFQSAKKERPCWKENLSSESADVIRLVEVYYSTTTPYDTNCVTWFDDYLLYENRRKKPIFSLRDVPCKRNIWMSNRIFQP